jgi:hypothetical protein
MPFDHRPNRCRDHHASHREPNRPDQNHRREGEIEVNRDTEKGLRHFKRWQWYAESASLLCRSAAVRG